MASAARERTLAAAITSGEGREARAAQRSPHRAPRGARRERCARRRCRAGGLRGSRSRQRRRSVVRTAGVGRGKPGPDRSPRVSTAASVSLTVSPAKSCSPVSIS